MDFAYTPKVEALRARVNTFLTEHIVPRIWLWHEEIEQGQVPVSFMEPLKARARDQEL